MGTTLTGLKIKDTYQGLIKTTDNLPFASGVLRRLSDGFGNETDLQLSTDKTVSANMEVTDNLNFLATIAEIEAGDDSIVITKEYFISKESVILDDLLSLNESVQEIIETPSGLTMFELKDKELYLSVDGEMPKKVDLSPIASEVKTVKLTITAAEIREASQYIDGNDNPNLTPVVLVPNPADGSAVVATEVLCKTTPINGMYDDSGGMGWIMPNKDLTLVLDHKEDYYQLMLNSSFLSPNYGDEPLGSPRYEKAKERDVGGFLNIGEAYNSFEEGKGIIFLFNEYLDAYPGTSIELIIKYQNITF